MFRTLPILLLFSSSAVLGQVGYDHPWLETIPRVEGKQHHGIAKAASPTRNFDIRYHRFTWSIDPAVRAISGSVTTYFSTTGDLDTLVFDLSDTLTVSQVAYHGNTLPFSLTSGDLLRIPLPTSLPNGTLDSISISYGGVPRLSGFGSFATGDHDGVPALWTLSEPYGAKEWWPCKQDLNDKIDSIDAFVTIPIGNRAAGNGVLASVDTLPGAAFVRYHWRHRYPIAHYLVATAVTNYQELVHEVLLPNDTVLMLTYTYPEDAFIADLNAGDVLEQMVLFSELFGTYPFAAEKYGHAQFGWGGGMEHQTMSFMGGYYYELAAHELAHQWFGDKVTCSTWDDLWLNEGFATYLTGLCYNYIDTQYWQGWLQAKVAGVTSEPDGSVWVNDTLDIGRLFSGRLTYNKGAMVLHMLRWVCGDTAFYAGVNNYLNDPLLAFASASTADLKAHLEASSGLDLTEFFADWFYGEGYPIYTLPWSQDQNGTVSVQLDQSTSHPSVPFFEMPVPVRFWNSTQDTTVVFDHGFSGQAFSFPLSFPADSAQLDPETWLVQANALIVRVPEISVQQEQLLVYPNPTADGVTLYSNNSSLSKAELRVIDQAGRVVLSRSLRMDQQRSTVDLSGLSDGMYLLEMRSAEAFARVRVIKQ